MILKDAEKEVKHLEYDSFLLDMNSNEKKIKTHEIAMKIAQTGVLRVEELRDQPLLFLSKLMNLIKLDMNVLAKFVIHYQLFGGTILELGTEYHHKIYFDDINKMKIVGGFAMTEMGHGSNVRNIETIARYDFQTQEFVIDSPTPSSTKFWIGNTSRYGTHVVLFCRLIFNNEDKGVHGIIVNIRDMETKEIRPGIELGDCGPKIGWNGIDNAWIRFSNFRAPRLNLLSRFASITESGEYITKLSSPGKLFQITISQLVMGRMLYIVGPPAYLNVAIKNTFRYAMQRRQFGEKEKPEELLINYPTHYQTLIPMISNVFALEFSRNVIVERFPESKMPDKADSYNAIIGGVKATVAEYAIQSISKLRTMCGGNGFSAYSLFGYMRDELEVFQTAEGDGTVLFQQLTKHLLVEYRKWYKKEGVKGYIIKEVQSFLDTSNPYYTHSRSIPYLISDEFHLHAFVFRFEKQRSILITKLSLLKSKGLTFTQSWNESLLDIQKLARYYTQLFCLESSYLCVKKCVDPGSRSVLSNIVKLYALTNIENDFGFYRNANFLSAGKALAISDAIRDLCVQLKPFIFELMEESFGLTFPDVPIGSTSYIKNMSERVGIPPYSSKL